jgi:hypothetical protein
VQQEHKELLVPKDLQERKELLERKVQQERKELLERKALLAQAPFHQTL